jgi:hypothetical protein
MEINVLYGCKDNSCDLKDCSYNSVGVFLFTVPCVRLFEGLEDEFFKLNRDIQLSICLLVLDIDLTYHIFTDEILNRSSALSDSS